jgi:hypothetical protein
MVDLFTLCGGLAAPLRSIGVAAAVQSQRRIFPHLRLPYVFFVGNPVLQLSFWGPCLLSTSGGRQGSEGKSSRQLVPQLQSWDQPSIF